MTAYIGYDNILDRAGVSLTASNEATASGAQTFVVENLADWLEFDWWKTGAAGTQTVTAEFASAVTCDYFALHRHNLSDTSTSVALQYSTDGITYTDLIAAVTPTDNKALFRKASASQSARWWRLNFTNCTVDTYVAVASVGLALELNGMRSGFAPPAIIAHNESITSISEDGRFLGRSTRPVSQRLNVQQTVVSPAWVRSNLPAFVDHSNAKPFFFAWDYENYPDEVAFIVPPEDGAVTNLSYESPLYMRFNINGEAWTE